MILYKIELIFHFWQILEFVSHEYKDKFMIYESRGSICNTCI